MAKYVKEIMNRELFSVRPTDTSSDVLNGLLALGITGAPVLDGERRPIGMVSLRDVVDDAGARAAEVMTKPAVSVGAEVVISEAGRLLAETGSHRLVVVDSDGRAIGVVSSLDVIRGLMGLPAAHPASFPHFDQETQLTWTDDLPLDLEHLDAAPDGPGLLVLVRGGASVPERVVWAESDENVYTRLTDMLAEPQTDQPILAWWLARGHLRFRTAAVANPTKRRTVLDGLLAQTRLAHAGA